MKESKTRKTRQQQVVTIDHGSISEFTFEQALTELEKIVSELEREDLTLDNALHYFELGVHLARHCDSKLKGAQGKVTELFKGQQGQFIENVLGLSLESFVADGDITDE